MSRADQIRSWRWAEETFEGIEGWETPQERARRLLEEALELAQASGVTQQQAHELTSYTFSRPVGELAQEIGQVQICLWMCAQRAGLIAESEGHREVLRVEHPEIRERVRSKLVSKRLHGITGTTEAAE